MQREIIDLVDKPEICPNCGHTLAEIQYGTPVMNAMLFDRLREGTIKLGGCCTTGNDPQYYCNGCGKYYRFPTPSSASP